MKPRGLLYVYALSTFCITNINCFFVLTHTASSKYAFLRLKQFLGLRRKTYFGHAHIASYVVLLKQHVV